MLRFPPHPPSTLLQRFIQKGVTEVFSTASPSKRSAKSSKHAVLDFDESQESVDSPKQKHQGKRPWKGSSRPDPSINKSHTSTPIDDYRRCPPTGDALLSPFPEDMDDIELWEELDPLDDPIQSTSTAISADPSKGIILNPKGVPMLDPRHIRHLPRYAEWSPPAILNAPDPQYPQSLPYTRV